MEANLPSAASTALNFEEKTLPNGLTLRVLPMPEYHSAHVIYASNFGSINREYKHGNKHTMLPAGIAHFLEHKMFEGEDGVDAFTLYAETGASANAYTGFDRTSYIFTATSEIERNLDILLSTVGHPYFTAENVTKEIGIIEQEIKMYEDHPELRCFYGVLECLYHKHPIRDDIAGTVQSIAAITPELLFECCDAFYSPANMVLAAAGNITMAQLEAAVTRANLQSEKTVAAQRIFPAESATIATKHKEFKMQVSMPIFGIGFKELAPKKPTLKLEIASDVLTELLCGETSSLYRRLYDEGLVQAGFGAEYGCVEDAFHFIISGESDEPEKVREEVLKEIARQRSEGIDLEQFETCKKMMYGEALADLESAERVASSLAASYFRGRTPAEELAAVTALSPENITEVLHSMLNEENSATVIVRPL